MRVLVYKQTHLGDPDQGGAWWDCMGPIRLRDYDAVIGFGGSGAEPQEWGIAGKITWIAITPQTRRRIVRFERFRNFGNNGPFVKDELPTLARTILKIRHKMIQDNDEMDKFIEESTRDAPASRDYNGSRPCRRPIC